jgi:hypothetical protein
MFVRAMTVALAITNAAAAGTSPVALMARSGHSDFKTTQIYSGPAGERFRDRPMLLERRLRREIGTKSRYQTAEAFADEETEEAVNCPIRPAALAV